MNEKSETEELASVKRRFQVEKGSKLYGVHFGSTEKKIRKDLLETQQGSPSKESVESSQNKPVSNYATEGPSKSSANQASINSTSVVEQDYKSTHPIGSRKVTENVITYHEPIFQSLANTRFENQKNLAMGKRKLDEDRNKADSVSPDAKKKKTDNVKSSPNDTHVKIKKKCTIENIIERIRTEKTMSRGATGESEPPTNCNSLLSKLNVKTESKEEIQKSPEGALAGMFKIVDSKEKLDKISDAKSLNSPTKQVDNNCKKEKKEYNSKGRDNFILSAPKSMIKQEICEQSNDQNEKCKQAIDKKTEVKTEPSPKKKASVTSPKQVGKVTSSSDDSNNKTKKCNKKIEQNEKEKKVKKTMKEKDKSKTVKLDEKRAKVKKKKKDSVDDGDGKNTNSKETTKEADSSKMKGECNKVLSAYETHKPLEPSCTQPTKSKGDDKQKIKKSEPKQDKPSSPDNKKKKKEKDSADTKQKNKKPKKQPKQQKPPVFQGRVKRLASLNAATFVNILYEKSPKSSKLSTKRSKSESDLSSTPQRPVTSSVSYTSIVDNTDQDGNSSVTDSLKVNVTDFSKPEVLKSAMKSPSKDTNSQRKVSENKSPSPKRKISFSDDIFMSDDNTEGKRNSQVKSGRGRKKTNSIDMDEKEAKVSKPRGRKKKEESQSTPNNKKKVKLSPSKTPEEIAERKRKANLARLEKAKELLRAKKLKAKEETSAESSNSDTESSSDEKEDSSDSEFTLDSDSTEKNIVTKARAKRGELFRSARTHISVEAKTMFENTASSPKWCECCQTSYFPSQPQQGMKVWLLKQLVDKGSSRAPEPIQSSSHHFINAHASCEVRPYSSPTHVPMLESSPYVGPLVSHSHVSCSACGCGHSGMLQCQNYSLGGVGNILPCQHYSSTYTVPYPPSSYTRCGCANCCPSQTYHHGPSQPHLHQPQIPISTDASILLHRPVQLQMTHEASHSVPIQLSHSDTSLSSHSLPLHISHSDSNVPDLAQSCHCLPGEVTNVSLVRSNTQSDVEFIDVGKEDVERTQTSSASVFMTGIENNKTSSKLTDKLSKLKTANKNSEKLTKQIKKSSEQLKKQRINELLEEKAKSKQEQKSKKSAKLVEVKKKPKLLDFKIKKNSKPDVGLEKGTKKVINKKPVGKKAKKDSTNEIKEAESVEKEELREEPRALHGWSWDGEGYMKMVTNIFDGKEIQRKCYNGICHDDGEVIKVKDCILVCSGRKMRDIPYVAKVSNFWEDEATGEMMMTILWYYRPEHTDGGRKPENQQNELFAAKHRDESLVACIEDRGYVLTFNEYCRYRGEVQRTKNCFPPRKRVVPDLEDCPPSTRMPPIDVDPDTVFLCRHVYDLKLKRVLKNPS